MITEYELIIHDDIFDNPDSVYKQYMESFDRYRNYFTINEFTEFHYSSSNLSKFGITTVGFTSIDDVALEDHWHIYFQTEEDMIHFQLTYL